MTYFKIAQKFPKEPHEMFVKKNGIKVFWQLVLFGYRKMFGHYAVSDMYEVCNSKPVTLAKHFWEIIERMDCGTPVPQLSF